MARKKVEIVIKPGKYSDSHKNGAYFTSVGFEGKTYGQSSPCDTPEEIERAIESCKSSILQHGDIAIVVDKRPKKYDGTLLNWIPAWKLTPKKEESI